MDSIVLAKFLGLVLILIGLGIFSNRESSKAIVVELTGSPALRMVAGTFPLLIGAFVVSTHNHWDGGWRVLITVIGWILLAGGTFRIWFPGLWTKSLFKAQEQNLSGAGGLVFAGAGVILLYFTVYG